MCLLHMVTGTQSEWHGIKVCMWGALVMLGIFKKTFREVSGLISIAIQCELSTG